MLLTNTVSVKIVASNLNYWRDRGYAIPFNPAPRWRASPVIEVDTLHLAPDSNVKLEFWCEGCDTFFTGKARILVDHRCQYCKKCHRKYGFLGFKKGNTVGSANKGREFPTLRGALNPRWNPNKSALKAYTNRVHWLTSKQPVSLLPDSDKPRKLCGFEGGYQLDHIFPIKLGFDSGIEPEALADISNLRFVPWKENRTKRQSLQLDHIL